MPSSSSTPTLGQIGGDALNGLNVYQGLQRGGLAGYGSAAINAANLANKVGGANIPYLGPAANALGIYNGIKQGGVQGYGGAAANAAGLYSGISNAIVANGGSALAGSGAIGAAAQVAGPLAIAWTVRNLMANQNNNQYAYNVTDPDTGQHLQGTNPMEFDSLLNINGRNAFQVRDDFNKAYAAMTPQQQQQYWNNQNKDSGMGTGH